MNKSTAKKHPKKRLFRKQREDKKIDEAISESFPASDPPAWYGGKDKKKKK